MNRIIAYLLALGLASVSALAQTPSPAPGLPSGGSAGGDLTGTYPNPTIKASVGLTGSPTSTTPAITDNSTRIATTAYIAGRPELQVSLASDQNGLTNNTWTPVTLPAATIDTAGGWSASTHLYIVPVAGKYLISAQATVVVTDVALSNQTIAISKNGAVPPTGSGTILEFSTILLPIGSGTGGSLIAPAIIVQLAAADTVELDVKLSGTANLDVLSGQNQTQMTIEWVGP